MIRTAALTLAAWLSMISAWLAIRELRWIFWRDRCGKAEVERDHFKRRCGWLEQELGEAMGAAAFWQQQAGDHVEKLREAGAI